MLILKRSEINRVQKGFFSLIPCLSSPFLAFKTLYSIEIALFDYFSHSDFFKDIDQLTTNKHQ